ncbi:RNA-binding domain-containing protein [Clostridium algidicarnis]|uniref:RNA-binding domain-containing protein n=1 Tax=Clostridium algidicarnis TaxID=37659 RepID=UPI001C0D16F3|nr:putative DNA binding domain-containing protein [Clostridium algidicarnis]MBU3212070.1 putative DNA binding domain-containing protein [Clostridium algidicarnis]MBU3221424.1 putative DNA binding domain-containing protein [Clostridium algidicarnis]
MDENELESILNELLLIPVEDECVEFKEAKQDYSFDKLGEYFSALSNESNLKNKRYSWLVFGVTDKLPRQVVGTNYINKKLNLESLKREIANQTTANITFIEIYEIIKDEKRVIMFQIPAAPKGIPIAWKGHYYGRDGESIGALNIEELEKIRNQANIIDWSAQICQGATINDLDEEAISKAREQYKIKNPKFAKECDKWNDELFLNKAKITINGQITRTAIILLGKEESDYFLSPSTAKITWILKDENNVEMDYEHFGTPFILNVDKLFNKIRNLKYRYMTEITLFPTEITQYEPFVIREVLHNCIVHQDYILGGKINVVERPYELIFSNLGSFIPKTVENVIERDSPEEYYRNQFLANAMVNLNMIDTIGSGIKKMFIMQMQRYFPLPNYNLSQYNKVSVKIIGKILDENYTRLLINNTNLDLKTVIALDKVQKRETLTEKERKLLRKLKLIEGRYPNIYVTSQIASVTNTKAKYIKNRAFDKDYYKKLIIEFLKEYKSASRKEIEDLLIDKLPEFMNKQQRYYKISNIIKEMSKKDKVIYNDSQSTKFSNWKLVKKD